MTIPEYLREAVSRMLDDMTYLRRQVEGIKTLLSDLRDADEYCHDCPLCPGTSMTVWVVYGESHVDGACKVDDVYDTEYQAEDRRSILRAAAGYCTWWVEEHELEVTK